MSLLAYAPQDLTVIVTADTPLAELQAHLAEHRQWLPIDPFDPARLTIGQIIDDDLSGPRRYGYGTIREHILSVVAELADGRRIKSGANVVKNAAGYDLCRLFTGARGELATVREVCFKVQPRPECEQFLRASFSTVEEAWKLVEAVDTSALTPVVLDLHHGLDDAPGIGPWFVIIGFAGMREDVEWQRAEVEKLAPIADSDLSYDAAFWSAGRLAESEPGPHPSPLPAAMQSVAQAETSGAAGRGGHASASEPPPIRKLSILPSTLLDTLRRLDLHTVPLLARAGNGILYYRGGPEPPARKGPRPPDPQTAIKEPQSQDSGLSTQDFLTARLQHEFDPDHKLPRA